MASYINIYCFQNLQKHSFEDIIRLRCINVCDPMYDIPKGSLGTTYRTYIVLSSMYSMAKISMAMPTTRYFQRAVFLFVCIYCIYVPYYFQDAFLCHKFTWDILGFSRLQPKNTLEISFLKWHAMPWLLLFSRQQIMCTPKNSCTSFLIEPHFLYTTTFHI